MQIESVTTLEIEDLKVIRFRRFVDQRGYFTEHYRKGNIDENPDTGFLKGVSFVQSNESFSRVGTIRGLHFQWNPYMGKLVRTVTGRMVDMALDIRLGSPSYGRIALRDMPASHDGASGEWIWVPPGFAHGNFFLSDTIIEYFCTGEYSAGCEAGISPLSADIDWSVCDRSLKSLFDNFAVGNAILITEKDKNGFSVEAWTKDGRSKNFIYGKC